MEIRLDGRTALITGGSRGLGRAMALRFAASGARVAIAARRVDVLAETQREIEAVARDKVFAVPFDAYDPAGFEPAHQSVVEALGPVDILVNNAGTRAAKPFLEVDDEAWQSDLDLKLFAAIRMSRLVLPGMRERGWGRILNTLAIQAKAPPPQTSPTSISRAAGLALTKVLAAEFAAHGITVNALPVGLIESDQINAVMTTQPGALERAQRRIPAGRLGKAEEFADLACFLASERAAYINGVAVNVDGGLSPVP
jgi:NAD(P)-dependent dehydrogenase (short-subunit alcohol dehydrogenase family)